MFPFDFPFLFDNPAYGLVGVVLGGVVLALFYLSYKRLRIAQKHLELVEWRKLRRVVRTLNFSTKAGVVIALSFLLARPYVATSIEVPVDQASEEQMGQYAITVIVLMDVSYSMNYSDLKPTRLEVSKSMSELLLSKMGSKDHVGFISYAGQVYDTVFPTNNRTKIIERIDNQTIHPYTAIGTALETAIGVLESPVYPSEGKAIVLFSDGKSNTGVNVTAAADEAASLNIPVFTVSMGTYSVGEADPLALQDISTRTGGKFFEVRSGKIESLATSISQISHEVRVGALKSVYDTLTVPIRDYQAPLAIFSVLLVAALFLMWFTGV